MTVDTVKDIDFDTDGDHHQRDEWLKRLQSINRNPALGDRESQVALLARDGQLGRVITMGTEQSSLDVRKIGVFKPGLGLDAPPGWT